MSNAAQSLVANTTPEPVAQAPRQEGPVHFQIHLKGKGHSGRAIRYRVLKPAELDRNEIVAAKTLEEGYTQAEFFVEVSRIGLAQIIVSYTDAGCKDPQTARWIKADAGYVERLWDTIFTTRDTGVLRHVFQTEHGVTKDEIETILAGKVEVLAD